MVRVRRGERSAATGRHVPETLLGGGEVELVLHVPLVEADPILGTILGLTTHRFGLSNLIPFSFDVIDSCAADIYDDGEAGIVDLLELLPLWGDVGFGTPADIDRDGRVGIVDLLLLLSAWGDCPDA